MTDPYDSIAHNAYDRLAKGSITNNRLKEYFNTCFQESIDARGAYQCWTCISCLRQGRPTQGWGSRPRICPVCRAQSVFEIATFQSRTPTVGNAFSSAFLCLMQKHFRLPLTPTPGNTETHDFEVTSEIAIEAKGSPANIVNPDGTITHLGTPGLERSDTKKKAFANARTHRQRNSTGLFFVVSNAVPPDLVGYRNSDVTAVFDVTKVDRLQAMMTEIEDRIDLPALRARRGL